MDTEFLVEYYFVKAYKIANAITKVYVEKCIGHIPH